MPNLDDLAHPFIERGSDQGESISLGLTKREHAAILLRVPESGDPDLDAMIRTAQRRDLAAMAMQGMIAAGWDSGDVRAYEGWRDEMGREAARYADAILSALSHPVAVKEG